MIAIKPVTPEFVAEIGNADLSRLTDAVFTEIEAAFSRYAVLVFHHQPINEEQQLVFAKRFGELEVSVQPFVQTPGNKRRVAAGFSDISNLDPAASATSPINTGTPTARSSARPARCRCSRRSRSYRPAAKPNSRTCALPGTRCPRNARSNWRG